jgi:nitrogen-specific signal transduction histidine kinase
MGLGLALAQKIAQEHGGDIKLEESRPGRTVFVLSCQRKTAVQQFEEPVAHSDN